MGYHTYSLAEFDLRAIGEHDLYIFFFTQDENRTRKFAEDIGMGAVAISSSMPEADGKFMGCLPKGYTPHAIWYATIIALCPTRAVADQLLETFKTSPWRKPKVDPSQIEQICLVFVPGSADKVISAIASYIKGRKPQELILKSRIEEIRFELQTMLGFDCSKEKNSIFIHTQELVEPPPYGVEFDQLMLALNDIRSDLVSMGSSADSRALLKDLKKIKRELGRVQQGGSGVRAEVALGFDFFGNGAKVIYGTNSVPIERLSRAGELLKRFTDKHGIISGD